MKTFLLLFVLLYPLSANSRLVEREVFTKEQVNNVHQKTGITPFIYFESYSKNEKGHLLNLVVHLEKYDKTNEEISNLMVHIEQDGKLNAIPLAFSIGRHKSASTFISIADLEKSKILVSSANLNFEVRLSEIPNK